jgi:RNA polymerase sigma-70 factor (ECF subfamily)
MTERGQQLARLLLDAVAEPVRSTLAQVPELAQILQGMEGEVVEAWPDLELPWERFGPYLAARVPYSGNVERGLRNLCVADLYLCCACVQGERAAIAGFHQQFVPLIRGTLRKLRLGDGLVEDLEQTLIQQLIVGEDGEPMIKNYGGLGRLAAWLRVVTARTARRTLQREKKLVSVDDETFADRVVEHDANPDLAQAKGAYRKVFKEVFKQAMTTLSPRDASLLRYRFGDGLSLKEIGAIYRVHHATAHRWLQQVRETLSQRALEMLRERLALGEADCASIIRLIQSDFDMTLGTFFGRDPADPALRGKKPG